MKTGLQRIEAERLRQVEIEGMTAKHDSQFTKEELRGAAFWYYLAGCETLVTKTYIAPSHWPWGMIYWKPSLNPIRNWEIAGALLLAELDRLALLGVVLPADGHLRTFVATCARMIDQELAIQNADSERSSEAATLKTSRAQSGESRRPDRR